MSKSRIVFTCRSCGGVQSRWMGKCPDCGAWDALEEERVEKSAGADPQRGLIEAWQSGAAATDAEAGGAASPGARPIMQVAQGEGGTIPGSVRLVTRVDELDRVLGGGLVPGSVVLVGGDPGIGKSTLLLQAAGAWARAGARGESSAASAGAGGERAHVLYVSSEESAEQVAMRASRLGVTEAPGLFVLSDTNLARIVEQTRKLLPRVLVIDSVQMIYKADLSAAPGSVAQLRRCAAELVYLAKVSGIAVVLVGHVTKDGQLAGPRLLEHLVDAVLYFEGDRYHAYRVLRAVKNRFGTTLEIGVFEMTGTGLKQVQGGLSAGALEESVTGTRKIGAAVVPLMTGSRCLMVEIQALTATGFLGAAKRKSSGLDTGRLAMIVAVLEQHAELRLADRDIFASSVGGIRAVEPAADLALLLAIAGSHYKRGLEPGTAVVGEIGLGGEVRAVTQLEQRVSEAARLGFRRVVLADGRASADLRVKGVELLRTRTVSEAIGLMG